MKTGPICIALFLVFSAACQSQSTSTETSEQYDPFTHCDFISTYSDSHYLSTGKAFKPSCEIEINQTGVKKYVYGRKIGLIIVRPEESDNEARSAGFVKTSSGQWKAIGHAYGSPPIHWDKLKMATHGHGDDITLIAWQTESSMIAQGGPVTINSISIFRRTPNFSISSGIAFEPMQDASLRSTIESELIKIVEGVKVSRQTVVIRPSTH